MFRITTKQSYPINLVIFLFYFCIFADGFIEKNDEK